MVLPGSYVDDLEQTYIFREDKIKLNAHRFGTRTE